MVADGSSLPTLGVTVEFDELLVDPSPTVLPSPNAAANKAARDGSSRNDNGRKVPKPLPMSEISQRFMPWRGLGHRKPLSDGASCGRNLNVSKVAGN
jgi:hypothetical protein